MSLFCSAMERSIALSTGETLSLIYSVERRETLEYADYFVECRCAACKHAIYRVHVPEVERPMEHSNLSPFLEFWTWLVKVHAPRAARTTSDHAEAGSVVESEKNNRTLGFVLAEKKTPELKHSDSNVDLEEEYRHAA